MIQTINANNSIVKYDNAFCDELQQRIDRIINKMKFEHDNKSKLECYIYKELTIPEYNEWIADLTKEMNESSEENKQLIAKQISYIERDKQRLIDFENDIQLKRNELIEKCSYPIDAAVDTITKNIYTYHQDLLDCIFESYINKIKQLCPEDKNYESTIKSIYQEKESRRVINLFDSLTNKLIDGFTKLIRETGTNSMFSQDVKMYDKLNKLVRDINYSCDNLYMGYIIDSIDNKIKQYPSKQMTSSLLVKSYSRTLMSNLNDYIINSLSIDIDNEVKGIFVKICEYELLKDHVVFKSSNVEAINQHEDVKCNGPVIEEIPDVETTTPNFTNFINSLSNEPIDIEQLTDIYNKFFDVNKNSVSLGILLKKSNRFSKIRITKNGKKTTCYQKI